MDALLFWKDALCTHEVVLASLLASQVRSLGMLPARDAETTISTASSSAWDMNYVIPLQVLDARTWRLRFAAVAARAIIRAGHFSSLGWKR